MNKSLVQRAIIGDESPHLLLREIGISSLQKQAGMLPQSTEKKLPTTPEEFYKMSFEVYGDNPAWYYVYHYLRRNYYDGDFQDFNTFMNTIEGEMLKQLFQSFIDKKGTR